MSKKLYRNLYYLSLIISIILSLVLLRLLKVYDICCFVLRITSPIVFGYLFAWILKPVYEYLKKYFGDLTSCAFLILIFILTYVILIWKFIPILLENISSLINLVKETIDKLSNYPFLESLKNFKTLDMEVILSSCTNIVSLIGTFFLIHIFGFYMLYNYDSVTSFLERLIPKRYKKHVLSYIKKLSSTMRLFIKGTLIDTLILFIISSIFYMLIGLKNPLFLAFFSAITNIIPFVGPYIGGIPAVLVGLSMSVRKGVLTLASIIIAQTVESNIINPMIMSKCISINPFLIVISLTLASNIFGLFGLIFAVPLIIIFKVSYEFYIKYKKNVSLQA